MKTSELAMIMAKMIEGIDNIVHDAAVTLNNTYQAGHQDNELADKEMDVHNAMVNHIIYSAINSKYKKYYDISKKSLDAGVEALGNDANGVPGSTVNLFEDNVFRFSKKQNQDGSSTLVTDLVTALARAGVDKPLVDNAMKMATKVKRGNTYYEITVVED